MWPRCKQAKGLECKLAIICVSISHLIKHPVETGLGLDSKRAFAHHEEFDRDPASSGAARVDLD